MTLSIAEFTIAGGAFSESAHSGQLLGEYLVRPMLWGSDWTKIRIGCRHNYGNGTSNVASPPPFYLGLCSNNKAPTSSVNPDLFLGIKSRTDTWVTNAVPGGRNTNIKLSTCMKVGSTETLNSIGTSNDVALAASYPFATFIEITKGATYNVAVWNVGYSTDNSTLEARAVSREKFRTALLASSIPTGTNQFIATGNSNFTVDEATNGNLDAIVLSWTDTAFSFRPLDIVPRKIS